MALTASCVKTYNFSYDKLSLTPFEDLSHYWNGEIKEYQIEKELTDSRISIETSSRLNSTEIDIAYRNRWTIEHLNYNSSEGINAVIDIPANMINGTITVYNKDDQKQLVISVKNSSIVSLELLYANKPICEVTGTYKNNSHNGSPSYRLLSGTKKHYAFKDDVAILEREIELNDVQSIKIEKLFYSTGSIESIKRYSFNGNDSEAVLLDAKYYNEDGTEMSLCDRLFHDHNDYLVLKSDFTQYGERCYMVLFPGLSNSIGEGVFITSTRADLKSIEIQSMFDYELQNDALRTFNYSHLGAFGLRRKSGTGQLIYHINDGDVEIEIKGPHYYYKQYPNGAKVVITLKLHDFTYNSWLGEVLRKRLSEPVISL